MYTDTFIHINLVGLTASSFIESLRHSGECEKLCVVFAARWHNRRKNISVTHCIFLLLLWLQMTLLPLSTKLWQLNFYQNRSVRLACNKFGLCVCECVWKCVCVSLVFPIFVFLFSLILPQQQIFLASIQKQEALSNKAPDAASICLLAVGISPYWQLPPASLYFYFFYLYVRFFLVLYNRLCSSIIIFKVYLAKTNNTT